MKNLKKQTITNKNTRKRVGDNRHKKTTYSKTRPEPMLLMDSQTLTMSPQGQITIPKAWREMLDFDPGEKILAMMEKTSLGKTLKLCTKPKSWVEKVSGSAQGVWGKDKKEIDETIQKMREEWAR